MDIMALVGKEDWLFLQNDSNHVIKQTTGELLLNYRQILYWKTIILLRTLYFEYKSINYRFIIPPNKESIYHQYLPDEIKFSSTRPVTQIINNLEDKCRSVVYYSNEFNTTDEFLFPKGETHWCDKFAYFYVFKALEGIASPLSEELIESYQKELIWCDLGSKMIPDYKETVTCLRAKNISSRLTYTNNVVNMGRIDIFENETNKKLPKAVVFRDSFFSNIIELFAESFSQVVYIWHPWIDWEVIEKYKPDIVVNCTIERFLVTLPNDIGGPSWKQIASGK